MGAAAALIFAVALGRWSERRRAGIMERFAAAGILTRLFPQEAIKTRRLRHNLATGTLLLLLLALAGPQWGVKLVTTQSKSTQVLIAVDTSVSMLAEDPRESDG